MLLKDATAVRMGSTPATKVYMGASAVWSGEPAPLNLAALSAPLHAHYDATQQTAANGSAVAALTDHSSNARTATKNAGTLTYNTAGINGHPSFDFVAGAYCSTATFTTIPATTPITVFAVAAFTTITSDRSLLHSASGFTLQLGIRGGLWGMDRGGAVGSGGTPNTSPHRLRGVYAASGAVTSRLYVDGASVVGPVGIGSGAPTAWRIGANSSTFQNFAGKLGELIIFNGALSTDHTNAVEAYLTAKWGV